MFLLKFPSSSLGKLKIWAQYGQEKINYGYSSQDVYYRMQTRVMKHVYHIGLKAAQNAVVTACHK